MKTLKRLTGILIFCLAIASTNAAAQTNEFTYQGKLTDSGGTPSASYDFEFRLCASESGDCSTVPVLLDIKQRLGVSVTTGIFTVKLDFHPASFGGADRFLEIRVRRNSGEAWTTLTPRQKITSSPYAIKSLVADGAAVADSLSGVCISCVTDSQINTVSGGKVTGQVFSASQADFALFAQNVSGVVSIANGGTGSATKNFVDLSSDQTVGGNKIFTGNISGMGSGLFNLNGDNITQGTISEARLGLAGMGFSGRIDNLPSGNGQVITRYGGATGFTSAIFPEDSVITLSPNRTCKAMNLFARQTAAPGNSNERMVSLRINRADVNIACIMVGSQTHCNSGAGSVVVPAGSELSIRVATIDDGSPGDVGGSSLLFGWECR